MTTTNPLYDRVYVTYTDCPRDNRDGVWRNYGSALPTAEETIRVYEGKNSYDCVITDWHGTYPDVETAIQALTSAGYVVTNRLTDPADTIQCAQIVLLQHPATTLAKEAREAYYSRKKWCSDHTDKWAAAKPCYLRYGKAPASGHSIHHADGKIEAGVSVYRGERLADGTVRPILRDRQAHVEWAYNMMRGATLYIVTGEELDTCGSDGNPLISGCRIWRKARKVEGCLMVPFFK